ncbi:MAG: (deoxy)nucleoside triphosphate pyrophosphohydrolase [Rhodobiaceae bacterium]|nr:(deoxy)nucleoside triphosphate pyrophosphohydrolase [Rhodobiaceae bacterium]MBT5640660.1 (deoxy)nucleoside triphosphate pyrophosphohydrolase [Rhodobiaceae bacterium]MBT6222332.1 (deoxy)nucleoside triphosphate pyrophosphohydrolase [Rhodobiaceae bacterium]
MKTVVACALIDVDGKVLINKRPAGKEYEGFWEFPGGKIEHQETPELALIRELREELSIDVESSCIAPLTFNTHDYDNFYLILLLYVCRKWNGVITPMEGQDISWVKVKDIAKYNILPADVPLIPILRDLL